MKVVYEQTSNEFRMPAEVLRNIAMLMHGPALFQAVVASVKLGLFAVPAEQPEIPAQFSAPRARSPSS